MNSRVKVALAQVDLAVGDVSGNTEKILDYATRARDELQADLVVFPELSVCGYPPEDLLLHAGLRYRTEQAVADIREAVKGIAVLVGFSRVRRRSDLQQLCSVFRRRSSLQLPQEPSAELSRI